MGTRGDPLLDLGNMLNYYSDASDPPEWNAVSSMPTRDAGFPSRDDIIQQYAIRTGFDVTHTNWHLVFGAFKLAVVLQQIYIRYVRGQTQDPRFAKLGGEVRMLVEKGLTLRG